MADETTKKIPRSYSRYTREAVRLLGGLIRARRIERRLSVEDLATSSGVSRDMMRRIEQGDPRCAIGLVFEAAAIVGDRNRVLYGNSEAVRVNPRGRPPLKKKKH